MASNTPDPIDRDQQQPDPLHLPHRVYVREQRFIESLDPEFRSIHQKYRKALLRLRAHPTRDKRQEQKYLDYADAWRFARTGKFSHQTPPKFYLLIATSDGSATVRARPEVEWTDRKGRPEQISDPFNYCGSWLGGFLERCKVYGLRQRQAKVIEGGENSNTFTPHEPEFQPPADWMGGEASRRSVKAAAAARRNVGKCSWEPKSERYPNGRAWVNSIRNGSPVIFADVVNAMTRNQRHVLRDYFEDNKSAKEIARRKRVGVSTIHETIDRICERFRRAGLPEPRSVWSGRTGSSTRHSGIAS